VLGRWSVDPPASVPSEPIAPARAEAPDFSPLLAEIREGQLDILRALRERPAESAPATTREPAAADDRLDRIAAAVDGITRRLEEDAANRGRGPGMPRIEGFLPKFLMVEKGVESTAEVRAELLAAHRFWSHRNLLDRYGTPVVDSFQASGYGRTTYDLGPAWVHFELSKDEVVEVVLVSKE
jgi:hypothetical protein